MGVSLVKSISVWLLRFIVLVILVIIGTFVLLHLSPVDPVKAYVGADIMNLSAQQYNNVAEHIGAHLSMSTRLIHWFNQLCHGDLGYSLLYNTTVGQVLKERFLVSLPILVGAWFFSSIVGIILALLSARYPHSLLDHAIGYLFYLFSSLSTYWISILLVFIFAIKLHWFPSCCAWSLGHTADTATWGEKIHHAILPLVSLSILQIGHVGLHTRAKVKEILAKEFIPYAKARGEKGWSLIRHHVIRHAISPAISIQFSSLGGLIGGTLLVEKVFSYPGLGQATIDAGLMGDIPLFMGIILSSTILVSVGNSIASILNTYLTHETKQ